MWSGSDLTLDSVLSQVVLSRSSEAELVVLNLPQQWGTDEDSARAFMSYCNALTAGGGSAMNLWGNWLGERMTSQRSSWCKARNKCLIRRLIKGAMYIGGLVEQLSWDAVVPIWRFETRGVRTLQHLGMKSSFSRSVLSLSLSKINSLLVIHHDIHDLPFGSIWDDEMSILNLTKSTSSERVRVDVTWSWTCDQQFTCLPRRTRSLWSLQLGDYECPAGPVDVCHVLARHANTRLDLRCAGSKNGALNIKTVPLTRTNIKSTCLATHVN